MLVTDAPNDPLGSVIPATGQLGVGTFVGVPLELRDGTVYGTLCALDTRTSDLDGEAVAALRILARLVVHELEHERRLAAVRDEEERRFRALVRHASDVVTVLAADGTVRYDSPAVERVLGYAPTERVGEDPFALVHPDDLARVRGLFAGLLGTPEGSASAEFRFRHADGSWRWLEAVGTNRLADPDVGGLVVTSRDVTERRRAEERLREAEAKYRTLVEQMPAVTYVTAREAPGTPWQVRYMSPQIATLLGYTPEEWAAVPGAWERALHPDDRARVLAQDDPTVDAEAHRVGYRLIARDGRVVWIRDQVRPLGQEPGGALVAQGVAIDVTAHHEAEDRLREAEAKYRDLVERLPAVVYTERFLDGDPAAAPRYVAPQIAGLLGYAQDEWLADPALWGSRLHPDDRDAVFAAYERAERAGEPFQGEYRLLARDGREVWVRDEAVQVRAAAGQPRFWQGFMLDVTDRRRAEARLRETEARYRALVESLPAIVYVQRVDGDDLTTTYFSPQVETILGYSLEERLAICHHWPDDVHPDDRARVVAEDLRTNATGEPFRMEYRQQARDGRWVWLRDEAVLVRGEDGQPAYWLGIELDVTERKEAEAGLREAEAKYRTLVEQTPGIIYVAARSGPGAPWQNRYASPQVEAMLGYTPEEWTAGPGIWEKAIHPDDRARVLAADDRTEREDGTYLLEYRLVARDGRSVWVRDETRAIGQHAGGATVVHGLMLDVTDRRRAEARLREAEARYRTLVESLPAIVSTQRVDGDAPTTYISSQVTAILGYTPDEIVSGEAAWADLLHPDDRERVLAENARTNASREPFREEYRQRARDGRWVWLRDEAVVVAGDEDQPDYWLSVQFDVTERKRAEEAIVRSEARFRALIQNGSDVVSVLAADGIIGYHSPAVLPVLGYAPDEMEGQNVFAFVHPEDAPRAAAALAACVAVPGDRAFAELRFRHKDGSWRDLEAIGVNLLADPAVGGVVVNCRDVTERKAAAAALRESEERFRALVRNSSDIILVLDADGTLRFESPAVERVLGYAPETLTGTNVRGLVHPENVAAVEGAFAALRADPAQIIVADIRHRHHDGAYRDLEVTLTNLLADPAVGGIVVNARDATERKAAEATLQRREARFRALVERTSDIIAVVDAAGVRRYASPAYERVLGYRPEELVGRLANEIDHPDDVDRERRFFADLAHRPGAVDRCEARVRHRDGSMRWLEVVATNRLHDPNVGGFVLNCRDVTERQAADAALRQSEERFRALVQNAMDVVTVLEADGTVRYDSPSIERVLGYAAAERIGTSAFALVHPDDLPRVRSLVQANVDRPAGGMTAEFRFRHKDGSWRDLEVSGVNLLADPAVGGYLVQSRDVTERKRAEVALRESEERFRDLFVSARRQAQELELLDRVRSALARELDLPDLFRTVVEAVAETFGYALVSLYLAEDDHLKLQHQVGYHRVLDRIPLDRGIMSRVARTGEPALVEERGDDPDFIGAFEGIVSEVCVPLRDAGRVVGVLNLESTDAVRLGEDDLRLMGALAEHVGVAIGRTRLYAEVRAREARFGALVRSAPDLIMILAADGTLTYDSPSAERVLGYAPGENIGANALAFVHPADLARVGDLFAVALGNPGGIVPAEFRVRHKDGSWRDLEALGTNLLADPAVGGIVVNSRDVSERKRTEEALRLSDRAIGAARDGIVIVDARLPDEPMVDVNPAFERISGYAKAELVGRNCRIMQGAETDPAALASFRTAIRECRETTVTLLNYRKDGTPFWNEVYVGPVRDEAGETTHFVGIISDVTERRQLEEQRERQVRYAALRADVGATLAERGELADLLGRSAEAIVRHLAAARATVWLLDEPAETLELAAGAGTVPDPVGPARRVPVGRFRIGRVAQDRRPHLANDLARDRRHGDKEWAARAGLVAFAGHPLLVEGRLVGVVALFARRPLADDTLDALASVADVLAQGIERKRVEATLRSSEERFRAIVETTAEWIWETDAAGRFTYVNPALTAILGYRPEEVLGRRWSTFLEEDRRRIETASAALAAAERGRQGVVVRWRHKDGGHRDLESHGVPIRDAAGETVGWRGTDRDVTERERTAREMAIALESQREANAELARLNRTKSDFVSVVSHEFRTPLTSIQGFSELIRDEDLPPAEVKAFADDVNRNALRLARMIGDMLDLDRLQSGRMTLRREPVDLNAAIAEVADTLRPIAPRHTVALDLDPALPPVPGDPDRLTQVVTNLLANAIKYAPDGGEIAVATRRVGDAAHLSVRDPGIGIPPDALETVFERYARVESGPGRAIPGTGLGLPIAREIVELHGGTIRAESEPGRGATFRVALPLLVGEDGAGADAGASTR